MRSEQFHIHQNLGNPLAQVERYNDWDVDELDYIDLSATPPALVPIKDRSTYVEMAMEGRLSDSSGLMALLCKGRAEAEFKMPMQGYYAGALPPELALAWKKLSK